MAQMHETVYLGGEYVARENATLSVASSAVLYGLSVYTVLPVSYVDGNWLAFRLEDHFQRLNNSAKIIGINKFPDDWRLDSFKKIVKQLLEKNDTKKDVFVRATLHVSDELAGARTKSLNTVLSVFLYDAVPILDPKGARLKTSHWRRVSDQMIPARAKVNGAYVNSALAKQDALDSGYDDCVFLDADGHVCELHAANIFLVRQGKLITPGNTTDILEGINRDTILTIAKNLQLEVAERTVDLTELYVADEVFACGTSANIAPIIEIDGRVIGTGKPGKTTLTLQNEHSVIRGKGSPLTQNL